MPSCSSSNASSIEGLYGCFGSCLPPMLTFWSVNLADHGGPWAHSSKWTRFFHDFSGMPGRSWKDLITVKLNCRPEEAIPPRATAESMGITLEPLGCGGDIINIFASLRIVLPSLRTCTPCKATYYIFIYMRIAHLHIRHLVYTQHIAMQVGSKHPP